MPRSLFDGPAIERSDVPRLSGQLKKVYELMKDGGWFTIRQVARHVGCCEVSAASRMRDLRKERFGGHRVKRKRDQSRPGVFRYRLISRDTSDLQTRMEIQRPRYRLRLRGELR